MPKHFEDIWNEAEQLHQNDNELFDHQSLIDEVSAKVLIYKSILTNDKISAEEKKNLLFHTYGEIIFSLTAISFYQKINSFKALAIALQNRLISKINQ